MKQDAYKAAGVDIDAGNALVDRIKPKAKATARSGVMGGLGGFGAFFDLSKTGFKDPVLVSSTDGVGTKLKVAIETGLHDTIGVDLVAMCVNDLVVQGAEPLFFLDYFATGKLNVDVASRVIGSIADGCLEAGCALIGGETAEMPGMYHEKDYDLAGFSVGAVERDRIITGQRIAEGDVVLGMASSGLHSNGYSLVRKILSDSGLSFSDSAPFAQGQSVGQAIITPTKIYVKSLLAAIAMNDPHGQSMIKGLAHITGGGLLENIPRVLPEGLGVRLDATAWDVPAVFQWLRQAGKIDPVSFSRTLNCGIGMVVVCHSDYQHVIEDVLEAHGETVYRLGRVEKITASVPVHERVMIDNIQKAWA